MEDSKVIATFIGLVGILVAALLSSFGYFFKTRTEHKKSARKVLYYLLEIRQSLRTKLFDSEEFTKKYIEHCCKLFSNFIEPSDFPENLRNIITEYFESILKEVRKRLDEELLKPFEESLLELLQIMPLLAHKLKGKGIMSNLIALNEKYKKDYISEISKLDVKQKETLMEIANEKIRKIERDAVTDLLNVLDNDITLVAQYCGRREKKAIKVLVKEMPAKLPEKDYDFSELDDILKSEMKDFINVANNEIAPEQ